MRPPERPSGMVGKRELLEWASAMARRDVTSFADLRDGDALVRCMRETWPLAYDACRKPRARTTEGNFELIGDMFRHLSLPPAAFAACWTASFICVGSSAWTRSAPLSATSDSQFGLAQLGPGCGPS